MIIITFLGVVLFMFCMLFSAVGAIPNLINELLYEYFIIIPLVIVVVIDYVKYNDSTVRQSGAVLLILSLVSHLLMSKFYNTGGGFENLDTNVYLLGLAGLFAVVEVYFCIIFFANVNDCKKKVKNNKK